MAVGVFRCIVPLAAIFVVLLQCKTASGDCLPVNQIELVCLKSNSETPVALLCPPAYTVFILNVSVYNYLDGKEAGCPTTHDPTRTLCNGDLVKTAYLCTGSTCLLTLPNTTSAVAPAGDACTVSNVQTAYAIVTYRCQPQFSVFLNGSASAIALDEQTTVSNPLIAVNSHMTALTGTFINQSSSFCSAVLPANAEAVIKMIIMSKRPNSEAMLNLNAQCVDIAVQDGPDTSCITISRLCSTSDRPIVLSCFSMERYVRISYTNKNPNVSILFVINLQVSYLTKITVACGTPSFPLHLPTTKATVPQNPDISRPGDNNIDESSRASSENGQSSSNHLILIVALSCGIGGYALIMITILIVVICNRSKHQRSMQHRALSESPSVSSATSSYITTGKDAEPVITYDNHKGNIYS